MKPLTTSKIFTAVSLALSFSGPLLAQESSGEPDLFSNMDNSRSLTDLMFMASAREGAIFSNYSSTTNEVEINEQSTKQLFAKSKDTSSEIAITSVFGITDRLNAAFKLGYLVAGDSKINYGPASSNNGVTTNTTSLGFQDIDFGIKHRLLMQDSDKVNLDIGFSYSPKLQSGKNAEVGKKGDAYRGGDKTSFLFQVGNKFQNFSYMLEAALNIYGERTNKDSTSTYKTTGGNDLTIRLIGQYRFNEFFLADFGFGRGSVEAAKLEDDGGSVINEKSADGYGVFIAGQLALKPGSEYIVLDYSRLTLGQHTLDTSGTIYNVGEAVISEIGVRFVRSF